MKQKIISIVSDIIGVSEDELEARQDETGVWDSLSRVEIVFALEEEFQIQFTQEEIKELNSIAGIVKVMENKEN